MERLQSFLDSAGGSLRGLARFGGSREETLIDTLISAGLRPASTGDGSEYVVKPEVPGEISSMAVDPTLMGGEKVGEKIGEDTYKHYAVMASSMASAVEGYVCVFFLF